MLGAREDFGQGPIVHLLQTLIGKPLGVLADDVLSLTVKDPVDATLGVKNLLDVGDDVAENVVAVFAGMNRLADLGENPEKGSMIISFRNFR